MEGTVRLDGKPLAGVEVHFAPMTPDLDSQSPPYSRDLTDDDGHFTLKSRNDRSGAVPGSYAVMVRPPSLRPEPGSPRPKTPLVPAVYRSLATTPLRIEVKVEQTVYDLDLKSKAK